MFQDIYQASKRPRRYDIERFRVLRPSCPCRRGTAILSMAVTLALPSASAWANEIKIDQIKACIKSANQEHNPFVDIMRLPGTSLRRAVTTAESLARVTFYYIAPGSKGSEAGGYIELKSLADPNSIITLALKPGEYRVETKLATGKYLVQAFSKNGLVAPPRILNLASDLDNVPIHLGDPNLPYIRMGFGLIPVRPSEETIAIVFENGGVPAPELKQAIETLTKKLDMQLVRIKFDDKATHGTQHHSIWLYRISTGIDRESLFKQLWANLPRSLRIGIPVDWDKGTLRVIDNRYVVRFSPDLIGKTRAALLDELGLRKFREHKGDPDLWAVEFPRAQIAENTQTINCPIENDVLMTGEPDLVVNFFHHDGFPDEWPNDPRYKYQRSNHDPQQIREAWGVLHGQNSGALSPSIGNSLIYIGVVDGPINPEDVEIACKTGVSNASQL